MAAVAVRPEEKDVHQKQTEGRRPSPHAPRNEGLRPSEGIIYRLFFLRSHRYRGCDPRLIDIELFELSRTIPRAICRLPLRGACLATHLVYCPRTRPVPPLYRQAKDVARRATIPGQPRVATAIAVRPEEKDVHQNKQRVEDPHLMHRKMRVFDPQKAFFTAYFPQVSPLRGCDPRRGYL